MKQAGDETAGDETAGDETAGDETAGDETRYFPLKVWQTQVITPGVPVGPVPVESQQNIIAQSEA